ncbi:alpha/beta hydrolase (plasmid) [Nocardia sp. CA-084685]|uniref:alpha/beta hydrolase n=1 Tax=Nocardia sp. CA-084685 TaxID=3239970 RepID=UPI003D988F12
MANVAVNFCAGAWRAVLVVGAAITVLLSSVPAVGHAEQPRSESASCEATSWPVPLGAMGGTLCQPSRSTGAIVILLSGAATSSRYWDWPVQPQTYSFRRALNAAGYATLALDLLGTGTSTRPPSMAVTSTLQAQGVHEIVTALRNGSAGHPEFRTVIVGGVSLGAGVAAMAASTYHDVDGVLLQGFSHSVNPLETLRAVATFVPAFTDPRFFDLGLDPGYLTTRPGTRAASFVGPDTDPVVLGVDDAEVADTFSPVEMGDGLTSTIPPLTSNIDVPVLIVNGELDLLCARAVCASNSSLTEAERPYFAPAARLRTLVVPKAGHAVTVAPNATRFQNCTAAWIDWATTAPVDGGSLAACA